MAPSSTARRRSTSLLCPEWEISWQRAYRLALAHVKGGGVLPAGPGELIVQGEDLEAWIGGQQTGWDRLEPAQQYLLETLGIQPAGKDAPQPARRSQSAAWSATSRPPVSSTPARAT
ncbi:hypothetical protein [Streptomyces sp. NPDC050564]|uniref:hypothetical protein n=1 Tax=Streptomyces sp. NPDC050564 TaxID=3365631 RepID=UPI00379D73C1